MLRALLLSAAFLAAALPAADLKKLEDFQAAAATANAVLTIPKFETTPEDVAKAAETVLKEADAALDAIGKVDPKKVVYGNTIGALDDIGFRVGSVANRLYVIKATSPEQPVRRAAEEGVTKIEKWSVALDYREDVYKSIAAFAKTKPKLTGEQARLLEHVLRDYKRAGLALQPGIRKAVERKRKELADLTTTFATNITESTAPVTLTRDELLGVPEDFLGSPKVKKSEDGKTLTLMVNETYQYQTVMDHAKLEATRRKVYVARDSLAADKNADLLNQIVLLRADIARTLGYKSWADFQTEPKMAKTGAGAAKFIEDLVAGVQPKFEAELAELQALKAADTSDPKAKIQSWDWRYYVNQLRKQKYQVDAAAMKVYFPMEQTLAGMFRIYEQIFGLKFTQIEAPQKWVDDLQLWMTTDAATGEPMGMFYLDLYPREGKYNHFAEFSIIDGKQLADGKYQRPICALVCNFPPPTGDAPSLLPHKDVETLFHEFGHAMHAILTRAKLVRFSGTSVPRDFVEAPSQMLEAWAWDQKVLDTFAADYRDPAKKIPADLIEKMRAAKLATIGVTYRRQFAFAALDLAIHNNPKPNKEGEIDARALVNATLQRVFLPIDDRTDFASGFGHLMSYDAGYYGYAWADAIAADMGTVFKSAPNGFFDKEVGKRLRTEIYEPGGSREASESVEKFLGRKQSNDPFIASLGIDPAATKPKGGGKKKPSAPAPKKTAPAAAAPASPAPAKPKP